MKAFIMRLWRKFKHTLRTQAQLIFKTVVVANPDSKAADGLDTLKPILASVIIPALNEKKAIASVVEYALRDEATGEVIVVDDCSTDETAALAQAAGATVITSSMLGKGTSMQDGIAAAQYEYIVFLDGDLSGLQEHIISDMVKPLVHDGADFVKACFGRGGGRVTELTAKPMLKVFFPELARFSQPLGGIISAKTSLLKHLTFESGYGVDIGLLIDAFRKGATIAEVDIGSLEHDSQSLQDLTSMANEVARVIHHHSREAGRLHVEQITEMYEAQRQATASFDYIINRQKNRSKLVLLDMDGTITPNRFVLDLANHTHTSEILNTLLDNPKNDAGTRSKRIAEMFKYTHRNQFEKVAMAMAIRPGVIEFVQQMKRDGFMVGIVSDSYFIAAEIMRKRIFADFAIAHILHFQNDICTGELKINPDFLPNGKYVEELICKSNVLQRFLSKKVKPSFKEVWAIGDNLNDLNMLNLADKAFVIEPKTLVFQKHKRITEIQSFTDLVTAAATAD